MNCKITLLKNPNRDEIIDGICPSLSSALKKAGHEVEFAYADVLSDGFEEELVRLARTSHAVIVGDIAEERITPALSGVKSALKLYCELRASRGVTIASDCAGIYQARRGYEWTEEFGRAAFDTELISELEIERCARVAYELAEREGKPLTLADRRGLLTSSLWRKIVSDINEDYPSVPLKMADVTDILSRREHADILLTSALLGDMLAASLLDEPSKAFVGDSPSALYIPSRKEDIAPFILKHSFDIPR